MSFNEEIGVAFAKNLKILRQANGWTQTEFSEKSGISRPTIAHLENADVDPRLSTILKIANAFGVPPTLLFLTKSHLKSLQYFFEEMSKGSFDFDNSDLSPEGIDEIVQLIRTELPRNRARAANKILLSFQEENFNPAIALAGTLGTFHNPGMGTFIGLMIGLFSIPQRSEIQKFIKTVMTKTMR